ncbi:MAG TPA: hypothetical protein VJ789_09085 [Burkholderiales bacterium]|nr:hypothetical protein [Burkholderiales bacterium]
MNLPEPRTPHEQALYARWLDWGTRAGLAVLIATFVVYLADWVAPHVPFEQLARVWSLPVDQYRSAIGAPVGWGWLALAAHSDYLNYAGIALLGLVSIVCYLRALPAFLARGDRIFALIAAAQIAVLALAAAGVLGGGH